MKAVITTQDGTKFTLYDIGEKIFISSGFGCLLEVVRFNQTMKIGGIVDIITRKRNEKEEKPLVKNDQIVGIELMRDY